MTSYYLPGQEVNENLRCLTEVIANGTELGKY